MRWFVKTRWVGVVGACGLVAVAVMLLLGDLSLAEAARRAGILLGAVLVLEHLVLPFARFLVGEPSPAEPGNDPAGQLRAGPLG
jgi:hypothetical protein